MSNRQVAQEAKDRTIAAIIIQVANLLFAASILLPPAAQPLSAGTPVRTAILAFLAIYLVIATLLIPLTYVLVHANLTRSELERAAKPALVLGILSLLFGGVVSGVLLLLVNRKLQPLHRGARTE